LYLTRICSSDNDATTEFKPQLEATEGNMWPDDMSQQGTLLRTRSYTTAVVAAHLKLQGPERLLCCCCAAAAAAAAAAAVQATPARWT
jgi:hypothetical protein